MSNEAVATLTIRNIPARVIRGLQSLASARNTSIEQEARKILQESVTDRISLQSELEASWSRQVRRPAPAEIDSWIAAGRK